MAFRSIQEEIKLIEGMSISIFIPINQKIVKQAWMNPWYDEIEISDQVVSGAKVWNLFQRWMTNIENQSNLKSFQKILNLFTVHVFDSFVKSEEYGKSKRLSALLEDKMECAYFYLGQQKDWESFYQIEKGLDTEKLKKSFSDLKCDYEFI